jgi:hypothetical protein
MKKQLFILIVIIFIGCDDRFNFETVAIYHAVKSDLKVDLSAKGYVLIGDDLGEGLVKGSITSSHFSDTLYFQTKATELIALKYNNAPLEIINPTDITKSLIHSFNSIGNTNYNKQEIKELGEAIQLTGYGPKATYMTGQTKLIKVIKVDFTTD